MRNKQPVTIKVVGNMYTRYAGKAITNIIESSIALTKDEVEQFRVNPKQFLIDVGLGY